MLAVAREAGVSIPTLCHLDGVSDVGACRLCLVEIAGSPSCRPRASRRRPRAWRVHTDTAELREYRKMIVELLLAERNHVCSVCVANGHCELQDHAAALGVDHVRFEYQFPKLAVDVVARALRHRPQPLHPVYPLRPRLRRDRRGAHLGRGRPRRNVHGSSPT